MFARNMHMQIFCAFTARRLFRKEMTAYLVARVLLRARHQISSNIELVWKMFWCGICDVARSWLR